MRLGLEAEYWVVDGDGRLCDGRDLVEAHDRVSPEFVDAMIEVETPPVGSIPALRETLVEVLEAVMGAAASDGRRLVPLGTPLSSQTGAVWSARGKLLERIYGDGIEPAKNCAGTHVHFERERVTRQLNLLTALDPALALVSSSPYYRGERVANCSRAHVYRHESGARFERYRDLWEYATDVAEWESRIEARYRELRTIAHEVGIDDAVFDEHFQPENAVLTPVRLRGAQPTVEWRAPDTALPSQILELVGTVADLVERTNDTPVQVGDPAVGDERIGVPPFADLRELTDAAVEDGIGAPDVRDYLETMGFDPANYRPLTGSISGPARLDETTAERLRLDAADALEADLAALD